MKNRPLKGKGSNGRPLKERKFVKEYIENGGNGTQAVIDAGYNVNPEKQRENASALSAELLAKPPVREAIEKALISLEITPQYILKSHKDMLEATMTKREDGTISLKSPSHGMVGQRALENIGKISDLYPKQGNSLEIDKDGLKLSWES